ncbi:MAG TPA: XrtA system polysaccharide chain length determinant [Stellaceae bacterium]|nr:XrtA system polysaccharide chain length determinant [Stellaceae bacterium]
MRFLLEQAQPWLRGMWRYRWFGVAAAVLVCLAGWIAVAFLPTEYRSSARVYVNADPVLTPLLKGLAADTDPTRQLDYMKRTLLSRPNLEEAARLSGLELGQAEERDRLLKHLATTIDIDAVTTNLLAISYQDSHPATARNVVQSLLTIFADKTAGTSRQEMDSAEHFLEGEITSYEAKLRDADAQRAALNREYPDLLPIDTNGNRLDQARSTVNQLEFQLSDASVHRDALKKELAAIPPTLSVERAPQVIVDASQGSDSPTARLSKARKRLDALRLQYTDEFPDVIAARREIAQLEAEAKSSAGSGSVRSHAVKAQIANSVYDQLKVKLVDAETAIAAFERNLAAARARLAHIEAEVRAAPGVLAKARDLERNYTLLKAAYEALVQRRQAAEIADAANTKTDQIQFRIVDPPEVPILPISPNRPLYDSLVLLLAIGAGFAAPLAMSQLDRSVATLGQLRDLGVPVVGSVSLVLSDVMRLRVKHQMFGVLASAFVLLTAYGALLAIDSRFLSAGYLLHG